MWNCWIWKGGGDDTYDDYINITPVKLFPYGPWLLVYRKEWLKFISIDLASSYVINVIALNNNSLHITLLNVGTCSDI